VFIPHTIISLLSIQNKALGERREAPTSAPLWNTLRLVLARHEAVKHICYPQTMTIASASPRLAPLTSALLFFFVLLLAPVWLHAQQPTPALHPPPAGSSEFAKAADEVLQNMSEITGLSLISPLKKTLRSREEIRAYVIRQMDEDKDAAQRYADARAAEAFGLLPKGFDLDAFMIELLTEQIAGLYDPKAHEFYIADWISPEDQRMVMAHELTHALEDQHFQIEAWLKAARPNDDAELAREAFLEGSAMAAMVDYLLQGTGKSVNDMPEFDPSLLTGDIGDTPSMKKAPPFIKDALVFPYFAGMKFTAAALKPAGWPALDTVFKNPPVSTQQVMHPALYKSGHAPEKVTLPDLQARLGKEWKKLDENLMGEFGWKEVLKQYLGEERAAPLAAAWDGDRYQVYEHQPSKRLLLVTRVHLASDEQANRFFGQYSELLEKKHEKRTALFRRPNFFSFETPDGGVFLRCAGAECVTLEGSDRSVFADLNKQIDFGALPELDQRPGTSTTKTAGHSLAQPAISALR
jgi:hypothetical protein